MCAAGAALAASSGLAPVLVDALHGADAGDKRDELADHVQGLQGNPVGRPRLDLLLLDVHLNLHIPQAASVKLQVRRSMQENDFHAACHGTMCRRKLVNSTGLARPLTGKKTVRGPNPIDPARRQAELFRCALHDPRE